MQLISKTIKWRKGDPPIVIRALGDIQWTGLKGATALDTLQRDIAESMKQKAWFIGGGDYIDFMSPSNRSRLRSAALYDTAEDVIDATALDLVHSLYEVALKPTKGRWLGMLEGHHFSALKSGDTTDMRLCQMLNAPFLGTSAFIRLVIDNHSGSRNNVVLWVHHGTGGGGKSASPLNKLENLAPYWGGVDVFIMWHTTKMPAVPINRVYPRWHGHGAPDLIHKKVYLVAGGGYSRAYIQNAMQGRVARGGYAEAGMMNPAVIGSPLIKIYPGRKWSRDLTGKQRHEWLPQITVEV